MLDVLSGLASLTSFGSVYIYTFPLLYSFTGRKLLQSANLMVTGFKSIKMDRRFTFSQGICLPDLPISSFYSIFLLFLSRYLSPLIILYGYDNSIC